MSWFVNGQSLDLNNVLALAAAEPLSVTVAVGTAKSKVYGLAPVRKGTENRAIPPHTRHHSFDGHHVLLVSDGIGYALADETKQRE